jgi:hypothetical protein
VLTNQTALWRNKGGITKLTAFYSNTNQCIQGLKITYGAGAGGGGKG